MARQISVIQFAGKMGNAVGRRSRKGNPILGLDQGKYHNPNTKKQVEARTKFLGLINASSVFSNCMVGLTPYAKANGWSLRNAFVKLNKGNVGITYNSEGDPQAQLGLEGLILSRGSLEVIGGVVSTAEGTSGVDVTTVTDDVHPTRVKHVVAVSLETGKAFMKTVPYSQAVVSFDMPLSDLTMTYYYESDAPDEATAVSYSGYQMGDIFAKAEYRALANQMVYSETVYHA